MALAFAMSGLVKPDDAESPLQQRGHEAAKLGANASPAVYQHHGWRLVGAGLPDCEMPGL